MNPIIKPISESAGSLKSLQTTRNKHIRVIADNHKIIKHAEAQIKESEKSISEIEDKLKELKEGPVILSEHAYLRYLERVYDIDKQKIYDEIVTPRIAEAIKTLGSGEIKVKDYKIIFRGNTIVTITPQEEAK